MAVADTCIHDVQGLVASTACYWAIGCCDCAYVLSDVSPADSCLCCCVSQGRWVSSRAGKATSSAALCTFMPANSGVTHACMHAVPAHAGSHSSTSACFVLGCWVCEAYQQALRVSLAITAFESVRVQHQTPSRLFQVWEFVFEAEDCCDTHSNACTVGAQAADLKSFFSV